MGSLSVNGTSTFATGNQATFIGPAKFNNTFNVTSATSTNFIFRTDVAPASDAKQVLIGSNTNPNLYLIIGVSTGTNIANPAQSSYCILQGNQSGSYYAPLILNPNGGQLLINKLPAKSITGSNMDVNGRLDCTIFYVNGRNNERTCPSSLFTNISVPAYWDFYVNGDFNFSFNTPTINRGGFSVSSGQITNGVVRIC